MSEMGLRVPPHSAEAERGVLGSVLLDPLPSLGKLQGKRLCEESFYDRRHQALYAALVEMAAAHVPMDGIMIGEWLKDCGGLETCGGYDYLIELQDAAVVAAHVEFYADIVVEKKLYRDVITLGVDLADGGYKGEDEAQVLLQQASGRLVKLMECRTTETNQAALDRWYQRMEDIKNGKKTNGLPLPWPTLDSILCGLETGLILIGARPSCGKTTMEVNIADFLAREGCPVARACLDMSKEALLSRSVIRESRVSLPRLKYGFARWTQLETVRECKDLVARWPNYVIDDGTLGGICSTARMLKLKHGIELLTVDFAQLVTTGNGHIDSNMNALMGQVTKQLKALAFELDIPVVLLSQLSRAGANDERPKLSHLRDSGNLEQNATQVILISKARDDDYPGYDKDNNPQPLPEDAERRVLRGLIVDVAKNQNGEIGETEMWLRPNYFRMEEAEAEFLDLSSRLAEWTQETTADEQKDPGERVTDTDTDEDDEVEV